ncbi:MAG: hypothetical protein ABJ013_05085 [Halioglobus sp.]
MSEVDQLLTIAEVSVALAGFAGIVATFQFRQQVRINQGHVLALSMIVNVSLVGAFFAVLPLIFLNYGMAENRVWSLCSGLMAVNIAIFMVFIMRTQRISLLPTPVKLIYLLFYAAAVAVVLANLANALGLVPGNQFGTYFISFVYCFFLVGYNFSRLLMLPLWKKIRAQATEG